ncbi:putative DNA-binding protein [Quillaja saponaria]|nr:putative DNA-binding protein [Quillaja saponaria]
MVKGAECLNDGDMPYDNSCKIEPKRTHQSLMDSTAVDLFPNKKQVVEVPKDNIISGMSSSNVPPWGNTSSFHSFAGHFSDQLFDTEAAAGTMNFDDRNIPSTSIDKLSAGRKDNVDPFGNDFLFGLSMSHTLEDPRSGLNYGGIRKVKVSQVKESDNIMSVSMDHSYNRVVNTSLSTPQTYNKGDDIIISMGNTYESTDKNFISMDLSYNKEDHNLHVDQEYKEISNTISMGQAFGNGDKNMISIAHSYSKSDDNSISTGLIYNKGRDSPISMGLTNLNGEKSTLSIGHSYNKGENTIISFGSYDDDDTTPLGKHLSSYELLMGQPPTRRLDIKHEKGLIQSNADTVLTTAPISLLGDEIVSKKKEDPKMSKKVPPNNFPSNVRSLLSTGMLDGVPVKYIAWSREKELRGVIKDSGYLCGCQSCNFSKVVNAYEFERHAGCKTKHPNNHIYFENNKTIYGIVQELRSTPQNMLFEAIQTITGSPINQKSFQSLERYCEV